MVLQLENPDEYKNLTRLHYRNNLILLMLKPLFIYP